MVWPAYAKNPTPHWNEWRNQQESAFQRMSEALVLLKDTLDLWTGGTKVQDLCPLATAAS